MNDKMNKKRDTALAKAVRQLCVEEAINGFRNASMSGLCIDGAIEAAVSAIEMVDVEKIIEEFDRSET